MVAAVLGMVRHPSSWLGTHGMDRRGIERSWVSKASSFNPPGLPSTARQLRWMLMCACFEDKNGRRDEVKDTYLKQLDEGRYGGKNTNDTTPLSFRALPL